MAEDKKANKLLKALKSFKDEQESFFRNLLEFIKSYLQTHPIKDIQVNNDALFFVRTNNRIYGKLLACGGSAFGLRCLVEYKFESFRRKLIGLERTPLTVARWCKICSILREMIALSTKNRDNLFSMSEAFLLAINLLKEGAMHDPRGNSTFALSLNPSEQKRMIHSAKEVVEFYIQNASSTGLNADIERMKSFDSSGVLKHLESQYGDKSPEDAVFALLFTGDRKKAFFSAHELAPLAEHYSALQSTQRQLVLSDEIDLLADPELMGGSKNGYYFSLLFKYGKLLREGDVIPSPFEAAPRMKAAINKEFDAVLSDSSEWRDYFASQNGAMERLRECQRAFVRAAANVNQNEFKSALAKCLNVDPCIFSTDYADEKLSFLMKKFKDEGKGPDPVIAKADGKKRQVGRKKVLRPSRCKGLDIAGRVTIDETGGALTFYNRNGSYAVTTKSDDFWTVVDLLMKEYDKALKKISSPKEKLKKALEISTGRGYVLKDGKRLRGCVRSCFDRACEPQPKLSPVNGLLKFDSRQRGCEAGDLYVNFSKSLFDF